MTGRMTAILTLMAAVLLTITLAASDTAGERKLQQAIDMIESKRDFAHALPLFEEVAESSDRALAARALLHLAQAQEAQGGERARATYEEIVRKFDNQKEVSAAARRRLAELGGSPSSGIQTIQVKTCTGCNDPESSISADGRFMVAADWDSGDLAIRDLTTGRLTRLMAKPGTFDDSNEYAEWGALSPDLRRVVYLWDTAKKETKEDTGYELRVMTNTQGAKPTVLLKLNAEFDWVEPVTWVDNDSFLAVLSKRDKTWQIARLWVSGSLKQIVSLQWRFYGVLGRPTASPDGRYIAYSALAVNPAKAPTRQSPPASTDQYIYVLPVDGSGSEHIVTRNAGINDAPVWTEDGTHIVFLSDRSLGDRVGTFGLWSVEVRNGEATGTPEPVPVSFPGRIDPLGISRSGSYYYQQRYNGGSNDSDVFIADLQTRENGVPGPARRLTETSAGANTAPNWSPDGKFIAFMRRRPKTGNTNTSSQNLVYDLVVHSIETHEEVEHPIAGNAIAGIGIAPIWFHDGKSILIGATVVNLKTGESKSIEVTTHSALPVNITGRALAPDDRTLYLATFDREKKSGSIVGFDLLTGDQRHIWSSAASDIYFGPLAISPDGRSLAMVVPSRSKLKGRVLARVGIDGSDYRELVPSEPSFIAWTKTGILYTANSDQIMRIPPEGGKSEPANLVTRPNLNLSPDGSQIIFSDVTGNRGLWMINNLSSLWRETR